MEIKGLNGRKVILQEKILLDREISNREYLMSLSNEDLLFTYNVEAGRYTGRGIQTEVLGGWEASTCQIRGHFLGHWLSAAAVYCHAHDDSEVRAKADAIIAELAVCQKENGGRWVAAIPEKYLEWIARGRNIWAPQYNIHKLLMGLIDMHRLVGSRQALEVADHLADWFYEWSGKYTREEFDDILDMETGGMLEVWCDLFSITGQEKYQELAGRYYRRRLFEPLLEGKDVLTNMHANTTIPEVLGCARGYEVFEEEKWLDIVKAYWKCAVTDRGYYVTGGQTQGEVWTPMKKLKERLGDKNQEHCTVFNLMRMAECLFRHTKDPQYLQYMEYNLFNGIMAQAYWKGETADGKRQKGLLTYFLPMKAASRKSWAGERDSFFCCHGTMVQANAALNRGIYFIEDKKIYVAQYFDSCAEFAVDNGNAVLEQRQDYMNGMLQTSSVNDGFQSIHDAAYGCQSKPDFRKHVFTVRPDHCREFTISFRVPEWVTEPASFFVNGELYKMSKDSSSFVDIRRMWSDGDTVTVTLPIGLQFIPLPDDKTMGAFRYGPEVLAGLCGRERILYIQDDNPVQELSAAYGRQWGEFLTKYRTENQDPGIDFIKLNEVGYEPYQIYFKVKSDKGIGYRMPL
ncbi:beta-L-arabinofuranosidase domain-containing protein [Novisyntrophococcus fermenticellae]|uniref:beta-L-arabinofuranosidase domain-containing protein n=1 Tax=Novisyntrophococcus fermenticellae TaxID=2068655 RepID=UPI001E645EDB|nr:beta-L-arabinofuranosidase domain-containing protein [Novisyntrophococcus fermenticellae]